MQRLEISGAVRPIYGSLGVKRLILCSHCAWILHVASFSHVSPPKLCAHLSFTPYMQQAPRISFFLIWSRKLYLVRGTDHKTPRYVVFSPLPCYLVLLRPKYLSQHPILRHPQPTFLPQCQRPSSTPIQNKWQNCSSVCRNLYIFG